MSLMEKLSARNGALELENARLREALENERKWSAAARDAYSELKARLAARDPEAAKAMDDEAWARSQFDANGSVCVVFDPISVTAKKFFGTGWVVVQHAETAAAALRALRAKVEGGAR